MPEEFNGISASKVYDLIDDMRKELSAQIQRVESKFDTLEAGRLTRLERDFSVLSADMQPIKKLIYGLIGTVMLFILSAVLFLIFR